MSYPIVRFAARHIGGSPAVLACQRMARGYANANYRLETTAGVFLLRHRLLRDRAAVEYKIKVHGHLRMNGFPLPAGDWWRRKSPIGLGAATRLAADAARRQEDIFRFFIEEFAQLRESVETPLPRGLIHGDVFPDNTLFGSDSNP